MRSVLEIVTPAVSQDLTVLATVKQELGIATLVTTHDAKIQNWIKQASDAISRHCNRVFGQETVKQTIFLDRELRDLVLDRIPVDTIAEVKVDDVALATTDYLVGPQDGILNRLSSGAMSCWSCGKIEISYVGGFTLLSELPYDIERACISMVTALYMQSGRDPLAKRIEIPGVMTTDYWVGGTGRPGELPPDVEALIAPYRSMRVLA